MLVNSIDPKIFKAYDIRGIYPTQFNENNAIEIVKAIYKFFQDKIGKSRLSIVLAYDMRISGPQLFAAAKETLVKAGANVIDCGMLSTPSFYFATSHYGYDCGIQITASHNPKEYNGMKFVINSPHGLIKIGGSTGMPEIKNLAIQGVDLPPSTEGTVSSKTGTLEDEVENALRLFEYPRIKKFKIIADPANAMGSQYIEALFKKIPAELIKMNFELDGNFPVHQPDPLNFDNLRDLQTRVLREKADLGLAPDGDGDRLYFIDEKGEIVPATIITALVARELLKERPGSTILVDIRYILGTKKIVEEFGGKTVVTKVGHAFITETLAKENGIFAGESSGHFYYKDNGNAESQLNTILCVLKVLTEENKTLSQVAEELKRSHESGEFNFKVDNPHEILEGLKKKYNNGQLDEHDGVSVSFPTWRFNVRVSNTEPLLRLNLEGLDEAEMKDKLNELKSYIENLTKKE